MELLNKFINTAWEPLTDYENNWEEYIEADPKGLFLRIKSIYESRWRIVERFAKRTTKRLEDIRKVLSLDLKKKKSDISEDMVENFLSNLDNHAGKFARDISDILGPDALRLSMYQLYGVSRTISVGGRFSVLKGLIARDLSLDNQLEEGEDFKYEQDLIVLTDSEIERCVNLYSRYFTRLEKIGELIRLVESQKTSRYKLVRTSKILLNTLKRLRKTVEAISRLDESHKAFAYEVLTTLGGWNAEPAGYYKSCNFVELAMAEDIDDRFREMLDFSDRRMANIHLIM